MNTVDVYEVFSELVLECIDFWKSLVQGGKKPWADWLQSIRETDWRPI